MFQGTGWSCCLTSLASSCSHAFGWHDKQHEGAKVSSVNGTFDEPRVGSGGGRTTGALIGTPATPEAKNRNSDKRAWSPPKARNTFLPHELLAPNKIHLCPTFTGRRGCLPPVPRRRANTPTTAARLRHVSGAKIKKTGTNAMTTTRQQMEISQLEDDEGIFSFLGRLVLWISVWCSRDLAHQACPNPNGCSQTINMHAPTKGKCDYIHSLYNHSTRRCAFAGSRCARSYSPSWGHLFCRCLTAAHHSSYDNIPAGAVVCLFAVSPGSPGRFPPWFWLWR